MLMPYQQVKGATTTSSSALTTTTRAIDQLSLEKQFESSDLIASSDRLVTQLGLQTDKNSNDIIVCQIISWYSSYWWSVPLPLNRKYSGFPNMVALVTATRLAA
jgi:hypothetical protein